MDGSHHHVGTKLVGALVHNFPEYSRAGTHRLPRAARALRRWTHLTPRNISAGRVRSFVSGFEGQTIPVDGHLSFLGNGTVRSSQKIAGSQRTSIGLSLHFYQRDQRKAKDKIARHLRHSGYPVDTEVRFGAGHKNTQQKKPWSFLHPSLYHEVKHSAKRFASGRPSHSSQKTTQETEHRSSRKVSNIGRGSATKSVDVDVVSSSIRQEQQACNR